MSEATAAMWDAAARSHPTKRDPNCYECGQKLPPEPYGNIYCPDCLGLPHQWGEYEGTGIVGKNVVNYYRDPYGTQYTRRYDK